MRAHLGIIPPVQEGLDARAQHTLITLTNWNNLVRAHACLVRFQYIQVSKENTLIL